MDSKRDSMSGTAFKIPLLISPVPHEQPKHGNWYRIETESMLTANGSPYHALFRCGTSAKLMIYFYGGGCCWDDTTASRPIRPLSDCGELGFYFDEVEPYADTLAPIGIGSDDPNNPFHDWNALLLTYGSADFHIGNTHQKFNIDQTIHFRGYRNFQTSMDTICQWVPNPDMLLIAGSSAGGFGVAMLADEIIDRFPLCEKIACCIDGSLLLKDDWHEIAKNIWNAPAHICKKIVGRNYIQDGLTALHKKYGNRIAYLFVNSVRDGMLGMFQAFMDGKPMVASRRNSDAFQQNLKDTIAIFSKEIPSLRNYLYDLPYHTELATEGVTLHTILQTPMAITERWEGESVLEWIDNALNGHSRDIGMYLLR